MQITQAEMVLASFHRLTSGTTVKVPYEELVIQSWRDYPEAFSLRSHPEHPDASDIHKKIYQTLKPAGYVVSLGNKVFRLTDLGIERAAQILLAEKGSENNGGEATTRLSRSETTFLNQAKQSRGFATWQRQEQHLLIDHDARLFFQFSTGTPIDERNHRSQFVNSTLQKAQLLGLPESDELMALANFLQSTFSHLFKGR